MGSEMCIRDRCNSGYTPARGNSNLFISVRLYSPLGGVPNQRGTFYSQLTYIAILPLFSSVSKLTDKDGDFKNFF